MALQKQVAPINFSQGLDTKTDPYQIPFGKFASMQNSIFKTGPGLTKRNGFGLLSSLPVSNCTYVTTFMDNLTAIGTSLYSYSSGTATWSNRGLITPIDLSVLPTVRTNASQTFADTVVASNGLAMTVYTEGSSYFYTISDGTNGQTILSPTLIPAGSGTISGSPRAFLLGNFFLILITNTISGTAHLQYLAIPITQPNFVAAPVDISSQYTPASTVAMDAVIANDGRMYIAWNGSDGGGAIRICYLSPTLTQSNTIVFTGSSANMMSVTAYNSGSTPVIYVSFYKTTGSALAVTSSLTTIFAPVQFTSSVGITNITSTADAAGLNLFYEQSNQYSYSPNNPTNFIRKRKISAAGTPATASIMVRSVGLASKAFYVGSTSYMLSVYQSTYQPSYFLITDQGQVIAKLAYENGAGYLITGLPSSLPDPEGSYRIAYLYKTQITPVNKSQGAPVSAGIYAQIGINLSSFTLGSSKYESAELGENLDISGGILWAFDGAAPVEQNFNLWPDDISVTTATSGGSITDQQYFYQVTYEWSDNQGNIHVSAPSVPITITTSGGNTSANTLNIDTLRLTSKTAQPVKIVIYRWSAAQQTYYQITSITSPLYNSVTTDSVSFVDTQADSAIIGNRILYTTGGVVENIGPPATRALTNFNSRQFLIDAEDPNLLWFSKQVIEDTPVEFSDLATIYINPSIGAQGSTGGMTALIPMDDKLIILKENALYYITGIGPDNTGANNDFSSPTFITGTVGTVNPRSLVMTPNGLMFQSDKGIWILQRNLQTSYIGADVEAFNSNLVLSALTIPGTNQVRFTLNSGITLMYDYYYNQWATFNNVPAVSSCLFQDLHTYINKFGQVLQETIGKYLDNGSPVLMSFTTGWLNMAGLQGFERAYQLLFLGTYITPHKIGVSIAYDYNTSAVQQTVISPTNYSAPWGGEPAWGNGNTWGGSSNVEQWRVFLERQKTQAIQVTVNEYFDGQFSTIPGEGLTLSGMAMILGIKDGIWKLPAAQSVG